MDAAASERPKGHVNHPSFIPVANFPQSSLAQSLTGLPLVPYLG